MRVPTRILSGCLSLAVSLGVGELSRVAPHEADTLAIIRSPKRCDCGWRDVLEIRDVSVDGQPVVLDEPVQVNRDWLRGLSFRIRNLSGRPLVYVGIGIGLLPGTDDRLASGQSWQYGLSYTFGKPLSKPQVKRAIQQLAAGEEIVLTAANIDPVHLEAVDRAGGPDAFRQAVIWIAEVQYDNGGASEGEFVMAPGVRRDASQEQPN
jgi:hypothetical protein